MTTPSRDLMVPVTVFEVDGEYGFLPSDEIDTDDDLAIIHDHDPWAIMATFQGPGRGAL